MKTDTTRNPRRPRSRGQVVVIFAGAMILFVGLCAIVIDVSWYWANTLRMQRAADAAALAGVIWLPGNVTQATSVARAEAAKNGYTNGSNGVLVTPSQDSVNNRRLKVHLEGDVGTFFARVLGISKWHAAVDSKAEYVLPVPMGSPENYYGVFGLTRGLTTSHTDIVPVDTPTNNLTFSNITAATPTGNSSTNWSGINNASTTAQYGINTVLSGNETDNATSSSARVAATSTTGATLILGGFNLTGGLAANESITNIDGIQVLLDDAYLSATCASTRISVALSYNGGTTWTNSTNQTAALTTSTVDTTLGSLTSLGAWTFSPSHTWSANDLTNSNFKVRLTATKGTGGSCSSAWVKLDQLRVNVQYDKNTHTTQTVITTDPITDQNLKGPGTACTMGVANCYQADGSALNPRGFWGTMNTQGAANMNGDAFQPFYDNPTSQTAVPCATASAGTACYDATNYYNYAIEMQPGSSNGSIYIYDPQFCSVAPDHGTGDRWWTNGGAVTSTYELYDTKGTLYDQTDDTLLATSGSLFKNMSWSDQSMSGANSGSDCKKFSDATYGDGRDYHDNWYRLYTGMTGGTTPKVYRLHTTSTDPSNVNAQKSVNGENSFALYASASGTTPRLYGIGAMQAFTPLKAGTGSSSTTVQSEFYLAQIDKVHAGKTLQISLWDPGDTDPLTASLEILIPTSSGWTATPVTYSATLGTANSGRADGLSGKPDCRTQSRTTASTSPINTYTVGGNVTGKFNGCWLTIVAVIPTTYNADQAGWWKIRYTMTGNGVSNDVTTWKADIRGNPVHLVLP